MSENAPIPYRYLIIFGLILLFVITFWLYYSSITDPKLATLMGGISGGIAVYLISFLLSIYEYKQIDRFRDMGVLEVLSDRRRSDYYKDYVKNANNTVQVMGTSCTRFVDDFANNANDNHVLIDALNKNSDLKVQFLIPSDDYMDDGSKTKFEEGKQKFVNFRNQFEGRVELKRHDFEARHSLVRVDDHLIIGPVFQLVESKDSPAIHLRTPSKYAEKYLKYFSTYRTDQSRSGSIQSFGPRFWQDPEYH